ncbi:MAG: metallophosphoesterase, partial [Clostridia bacterium]
MPTRKKLAALCIFIFIIICSLLVLVSCKQDVPPAPELHIALITDTHVIGENQIGDINSQSYINFSKGANKMMHISEAILKSALDEIIATKPDVLFIAGDITEDGGNLSHRAVAANLEKVRSAGIKVFVIPGNHDIREGRTHTTEGAVAVASPTFDDFANIYANFGYSNPLSTYEGTLSYTADIDENYRLIAIDANVYSYDDQLRPRSTGQSAMPSGLMNWAVEQIKAAKAAGKTPVGMLHFPVIQHYGELIEKTNFVPKSTLGGYTEARSKLLEAGLNYLFTGHMHLQSTEVYEDENGKLYDISTSALSNYPMPMRHFKVYSEEIEITTQMLKKVNEQYIPSYISSAERTAIIADFTKYAYDFINTSLGGSVLDVLDTNLVLSVMGMLGADKNAVATKALAQDFSNNFLTSLLNLKLYNKDKVGDEPTVEQIAALYGEELPQTEYDTVLTLALSFIKAKFAGESDFVASDSKSTALKYSFYSVFHLIDEYQLFSKLNQINSSIKVISFENVSAALFTAGKFPLEKGGILDVIVDVITKELTFLPNIDKEKIDGKSLLGLLSMFNWQSLDYTFGIPIQLYMDVESG